MQLKIVKHYLLISCFVHAIMAKALYHGGCYECEEEVWEEVPCDDVPSNSTTMSPPSPCYYTKTTPKPPTTAITNPITTTTMPTTTMTTPATTIPTTMSTTTMTTTMPTTTMTTPATTMPTTTTPYPVETTTPEDPYKKCYCECKVGCKEFCRKVVVNPDPKTHVVQVSKITAPIAQGPIEYTHYHQRELLHKPYYDKKHGSYSTEPEPQMPISNEIIDNNNYSNKYSPSTASPPATSYKETIVPEPRIYASVNNKHSYNNYPKISFYPKPRTTPDPSYSVNENTYAHVEAGFNNPYSPPTNSHPPNKYYTQSESYDFPIPLEKIYTKVSKSLHGPADHTGLTYTDLTPSHCNTNCHSSSYSQPLYTPPTSMKGSPLGSDVYISNSLQYEDSFNTLINEFLENNPSNAAPYEVYSNPFYSVSYSR